MRRSDGVLAGCFVLAAVAEAVARFHDSAGLLAFNACGAVWLAVLALRRRRPLLTLVLMVTVGLTAALVSHEYWPDVSAGSAAWIVGLLVATYSVGLYREGRRVVLGGILPLLMITVIDAVTLHGWAMASGIVFVSLFIGVLPTAAGRAVRLRRRRLDELRRQRARILEVQRTSLEIAVLSERLRAMELLRPTLLEGLESIAALADADATPAVVETSARGLLERTREEVLSLTRSSEDAVPSRPEPTSRERTSALRIGAQPWTILVAGLIAAGMAAEVSGALHPRGPEWLAVTASILVAVPLAAAWRFPLAAVASAWALAAIYSRTFVGLDGSLSEAALAVACAFASGALCRPRSAWLGLVACVIGHFAGVGATDYFGEGLLLLTCWLGGLAVDEASRLVEESRANNALLEANGEAAAAGALVGERLRIAREIHDVVGHSLTVIALQAGAARRLAPSEPARAAKAMSTVASVARDGVNVLMEGRDLDIETMLERVRSAGVVVSASLEEGALTDPAHRALAFCVVQEGLTNALRHAPGAQLAVTVRRSGASVELLVVNTPPMRQAEDSGTGRGLLGLRERLSQVSGQVTWANLADGGFELRSVLPVGDPLRGAW
ncbi:MAG: sensor histidine kinase [Marmoricola sp.]